MSQILRDFIPRPPTGASPLDLTGDFRSQTPLVESKNGSILCVCTKFEADISICSTKAIRRSQNFEIWSRYPGHTHLC